jgi:tRNA(Ile)-lysidine synthase
VFDVPARPAGPVAAAPAGETVSPWGTLVVEPLAVTPAVFGDDPFEAIVDAGAIEAPLELRPWTAGDAIEPLGGAGRRLVSDILTDARVPAPERAGRLVLTAAGRILWVVGHRLDAHAAARAGRPAVRLRWTPAGG